MRRAVLRGVVVVCLASAAAIGGFMLLPLLPQVPGSTGDDENDGFPAAKLSYGTDGRGGGVLFIEGLLDGATMKAVRAMLAQHPGHTTRLQVNSPGGLGPTPGRLAEVANKGRMEVVVAANTVCSSACVFFLAALDPALRRIDKAAWIRVHGDAERPEQDGPGQRTMDQPVLALSRNWHAFLDACPSKPLIRNAGIAMTWAEIQQVNRNPASLDCAKIAYRTKDWLFART